LPVTPRFTWPDRRVDAVRGCVAVERGPLVLCAESLDGPLDDVRVDAGTAPVDRDGTVTVRAVVADRPADPWPYASAPAIPAGTVTTELALIPYHRWAERGPSAMRVWLPT
jgi:DUF1680 family protein